MKLLLAAGIVRDIRFCSKEAYQIYIRQLNQKGIIYEVLETRACHDGTFLARIVQQYNSVPLIQLYED